MYAPVGFCIKGCALRKRKICNVKFSMVDRILVKGEVVNSKGEGVSNAGIEIFKNDRGILEKLGVIFANEKGEYEVSVPTLRPGERYEFIAYSSV